jgi:hypothetical protein
VDLVAIQILGENLRRALLTQFEASVLVRQCQECLANVRRLELNCRDDLKDAERIHGEMTDMVMQLHAELIEAVGGEMGAMH